MHVWAGRLRADAATDLTKAIEGMLLIGVDHDAYGDAAAVSVDQRVDHRPVGQRIGGHVDPRARGAEKLRVDMLEISQSERSEFRVARHSQAARTPRERPVPQMLLKTSNAGASAPLQSRSAGQPILLRA